MLLGLCARGGRQAALTLVLFAHSRRAAFSLVLSPKASTSTFIAPYNFKYDPNALPYVVLASGTVDNAEWGLISPATVDESQEYICEPQQYPQSALSVSGSNVQIASTVVQGVSTWYPQCNNTAAIYSLTNLSATIVPDPTVCNADLIEWLITNLVQTGISSANSPAVKGG